MKISNETTNQKKNMTRNRIKFSNIQLLATNMRVLGLLVAIFVLVATRAQVTATYTCSFIAGGVHYDLKALEKTYVLLCLCVCVCVCVVV
jgi:hypothetical protein